jgi:hypothetical protein
MHKLIVRQGEIEHVHEFETSELAQLYRDYHLAFGHWNGVSKWIEEKDVTPENRRFVVDERSELIEGNIIRFFKLTEGVELRIEEVTSNTVEDVWKILRRKRTQLLAMTDWTQLADCALTTEEKKDYRAYRGYLRVIPKLYDNSTVLYAKAYSFEEWKKGKR